MKITMESARTAEEIAMLCGGTLYTRAGGGGAVTGMCTDSREADGNTLFCAMRGERVDGHRFIAPTLRAGCPLVLCERLPEGWEDISPDSPLEDIPAAAIVVEDTVTALGRLAGERRTRELSTMRTVAVTGSVGKTTTKEMIAAVLSGAPEWHLYKKDGNYNSIVGLPLSMMEIPSDTTHAVLEMGMSGRGEIAAMTASAHPDIAVIANIGSSHLEHLGTRENIARAKLEIAEGVRRGGILLLNGDEPLLRGIPLPSHICVLRLTLAGATDADFAAENIRGGAAGMTFDLSTPKGVISDLFVPAPGHHMVWAGAFAAAVGCLCGLNEEHIRAGLANYHPAALRQTARTVRGVTLLEDCYNAAPESMRAALGVLALKATGRRLAVLGDMRELGGETETLHAAVGALAAGTGLDWLVTVGPLGAQIARGAIAAGMSPERVLITAVDGTDPTLTYPATAASLATHLQAGDTLLLKASRALSLEVLSASLVSCLTAD